MIERACNEKTCGPCSDRRDLAIDENEECLLFGEKLDPSAHGPIRLPECLRAEKAGARMSSGASGEGGKT